MKFIRFLKSPFHLFSRASFTLIEILMVVGIIAVISVTIVLTLNPSEILKKSRDSARFSDMAVLRKALSLYDTDVGGLLGATSTVYVSVPDPTAGVGGNQCQGLGLPTLPGGWNYACASPANYRKVDGTGWIPVNFNTISYGAPLSSLPRDPINTTTTGLYYTYTVGSYELSAAMESEKYGSGSSSKAATDGGQYANRLEIGTELTLLPINPSDVSSVTSTPSAPLISNVAVSGITSSTATVSWTTDSVADSLVRYGLTSGYGSSTSNASQVTSHSLTLNGLVAATTYHVQVESVNANGTATSSDNTFVTSASSTSSPPVILSNLVSNITSSTATVNWTTDVAADSLVNYGLTASYGSSTSNSSQVTSHALNLSGLSPSTIYHYQVRSTNVDGVVTSTDNTFATSIGFATIALSGTPTTVRVASTSSISLALPSGIFTGDIIFIFYTWGTTSTITGPVGYATGVIPTYYSSTSGPVSALYWRKYTTGDPTSVTATLGAPVANFEAIAVAYSGVDTINPIDIKATSTNVSATTHTSPSIITTQSNDKLLMLYGVSGAHTFSSPSEGTIRQSITTGPSSAWVDFSIGGSGATGNQTILVNTAATGVGFQVTLRPASL